MLKLDGVKLRVGEDEKKLLKIAEKKLGAPPKTFKILKKSLDARDKDNIRWVYSIAYSRENEEKPPEPEKLLNPPKVVIVGGGPAGLFCAVRLAEHGFSPIIVERGQSVEERKISTDRFFKERILDPESNVQFGEGGAGAYSDGKLNTQTHDGLNADVLKIFARFGAPDEILYLSKPHIGSDRLFGVLQNIRKFITDCGGEYLFNSRFTGLCAERGEVRGVTVKNDRLGVEKFIPASAVVLAIGHSARDTFELLHRYNIAMERRDFAVGVRVEHLASRINLAQYGKFSDKLPAADYKLVSHAHARTVFTFCMCPGGVVIPAASEEGGVVVNGMSDYARDGANSNSALMVQLRADDFGSDDLFAGMRFQREIERRAYAAGGSTYAAPVQLFGDFLKDKVSSRFGEVLPTYAAGVKFAPLAEVLPAVAVEAIKAAVPDMGKRLKGFDCPDALLTGVETRFTSPVRILRGENLQSPSLGGLYPCGEGSGYSGGITSSAADGLKIAEKIFGNFKNH